jgi:hypothetical protein
MSHCHALRRVAGAAGLVVAIAAAAYAIHDAPMARRAPPVTLLYVGADDCAPCRAWQQHEKIAFGASAEFARVSYREVKSPTLLDLLEDENWPADLRGYRDRLGPGVGVPLWLVIADGQVVDRGMGPSQWHSDVLPKIKELLP